MSDYIEKLKRHDEDDPPVDRQHLAQIAAEASPPLLQLRVKKGETRTRDVKIGPLGWSDSLRKAWDGYTYFGNLKESLPDPRTGDIAILNDFVFDVPTQ